MKQRQYTELQQEIIKVIERLFPYLSGQEEALKEVNKIKDIYGIKPPYMTLRDYLAQFGRSHTFHFTLNGKELTLNSIYDLLTDELYVLYPLTKDYYVEDDRQVEEDSDLYYHYDHYLILSPKED